jgi:hypothetical protein
VERGEAIVIDPVPGADERLLRQFVLGPGLALILVQRGYPTLHASAVEVDGVAVALLGPAGCGKSTTAAALHARGHRLVADDALAIEWAGSSPMVIPGFPCIKLWPEAARSLGVPDEAMTMLYPHLDKRAWPVNGNFATDRVPLRRVYVLADGPEVEIEPLRPAEAVIELIRHAHGVVSLHDFDAATRLKQTSRLVAALSVRRLRRPLALRGLGALAAAIAADVGAGGGHDAAPAAPVPA